MRSGGCPAGSSRGLRLDPFALPVRFAASDAAADGRVREIELHRERVVVRRSVAGVPMALNMPLSAFMGVALQVAPDGRGTAIVLAHKDAGLNLPLSVTVDADDAIADWRSWGEVLGLPLLVEDEDGAREAFARIGQVNVARPRPRRRRQSALKRRRSSMSLRRETGKLAETPPVHRTEREITARD